MHAYLVTGYNQEQNSLEVEKLIKKLKAKKIDFEVTKIADIRELGRFTNLKVGERTVIVLKNFDVATEAAQNAFLKNLEEPQADLYYILTAKNEESVLPTIASRCQIINPSGIKHQIPKEVTDQTKKFINSSPGEKLITTSKINKRPEAIEFIQNLVAGSHQLTLKNPEIVPFLEATTQTLAALEANGNVQLQLTSFVVGTA